VLNMMPVAFGMVAGSSFTCITCCLLSLYLARRNLRRAPADPSHQQREPLFVIGKAIEDMVRAAPDQYLWMHRYWKSRPRHEREASSRARTRSAMTTMKVFARGAVAEIMRTAQPSGCRHCGAVSAL